MASATRINDGTAGICDVGLPDCCPHSRAGVNTTGSPDVYINSLAAHRLGDSGDCLCVHGGNYESTSASNTVFVNGRGLTRIGDTTTCQNCGQSGSHVSGSPNVYAG